MSGSKVSKRALVFPCSRNSCEFVVDSVSRIDHEDYYICKTFALVHFCIAALTLKSGGELMFKLQIVLAMSLDSYN